MTNRGYRDTPEPKGPLGRVKPLIYTNKALPQRGRAGTLSSVVQG